MRPRRGGSAVRPARAGRPFREPGRSSGPGAGRARRRAAAPLRLALTRAGRRRRRGRARAALRPARSASRFGSRSLGSASRPSCSTAPPIVLGLRLRPSRCRRAPRPRPSRRRRRARRRSSRALAARSLAPSSGCSPSSAGVQPAEPSGRFIRAAAAPRARSDLSVGRPCSCLRPLRALWSGIMPLLTSRVARPGPPGLAERTPHDGDRAHIEQLSGTQTHDVRSGPQGPFSCPESGRRRFAARRVPSTSDPDRNTPCHAASP